jgi:hypothetical protein
MLPLMAGVLIASIGSGQIISRTGATRVFPILGTGVMAIGMFLLSRLEPGTSIFTADVYMFVLGFGLGCVMQVLVLAVQNAVSYEDLGVATAGASLFRSMGGSIGTPIFGAILAAQLSSNLASAFAGLTASIAGLKEGATPDVIAHLPPAVHERYTDAYTQALQPLFLVGSAVALVAFALSWFIPEVPLRKSVTSDGSASRSPFRRTPARCTNWQPGRRTWRGARTATRSTRRSRSAPASHSLPKRSGRCIASTSSRLRPAPISSNARDLTANA